MRFIKAQRHPFTDTPRKRAALARKQLAEREALPLFADPDRRKPEKRRRCDAGSGSTVGRE